MRIAMLSTPFIPVPPSAYGGTELIVAELCEGLRSEGHDVLLFTAGRASEREHGSRALYEIPVWPPNPYDELTHVAWALENLLREHEPFDVIHSHCPTTLPLARFAPAPIVHTIHHNRVEVLAAYYARQQRAHFVAVSERQRELHPEIRARTDVIHHGLDPSRFPFGEGQARAAYAVFLGRLAEEKGPHLAIDVARDAGIDLVLAGKPHAGDEQYFEFKIKPRLRDPGLRWLGEVDQSEKLPLLRNARALLFPILWEEPFGLVMVESMLCGTPVLTFAHGSAPEVVDDGVTGWVCRDVGEMTARLRHLAEPDSFDRRRCRQHATQRFGRARMVADYLAVYRSVAQARALERAAESARGPHLLDEDLLHGG